MQVYPEYRELARAIVEQAITDYVNCPHLRAECGRFFRSEYFVMLCNVDGEELIKLLNNEYVTKGKRAKIKYDEKKQKGLYKENTEKRHRRHSNCQGVRR